MSWQANPNSVSISEGNVSQVKCNDQVVMSKEKWRLFVSSVYLNKFNCALNPVLILMVELPDTGLVRGATISKKLNHQTSRFSLLKSK